jgi:hypothetical protein
VKRSSSVDREASRQTEQQRPYLRIRGEGKCLVPESDRDPCFHGGFLLTEVLRKLLAGSHQLVARRCRASTEASFATPAASRFSPHRLALASVAVPGGAGLVARY